MMRATLFLAALFMLSACSEPSQSQADARDAGDVPAWKGANNTFVEAGWKQGDKAAWESQLRNRALTQNEYLKVN